MEELKLKKEQIEPRVVIVDENDNILGYKNRSECTAEDIQRITGLWVTNSKGEVLVAQRVSTKKHDPDKWGPAAAGTVEEGETYDSNVVKEAEEEIGLKGVVFAKGPKFFRKTSHQYFVQWYRAVVDQSPESFALQANEVQAVRWIDPDELKAAVKDKPDEFLATMPGYMEVFCK